MTSREAVHVQVDKDFKPLYKTDDSYGIALMILGFLLIPFSQIVLWKNEQRAVKFAYLLSRAQKACIIGNINSAESENMDKLIHLAGITKNHVNLCDRDFSVVAQDSYRLKRKVEMYQW